MATAYNQLNGKSPKMTNAPETQTALDQFAQFAHEFASMPNEATALTWGYEIESNTMANVHANAEENADYATVNSVDWQSDASVSDESDYAGNEDCNCDCRYCEHSCDCEHCDSDNYELEHDCGSGDCYGGASEYQEVTSIGALTESHPRGLDLLAEWGINNATFNSDCGIHIHIGSSHFTAPQVANIMTAYRLAKPILDQIAERSNTTYATSHTPEMENSVRAGSTYAHKYQEVNISNQFQTYRAQTLEFRQMAGKTQAVLRLTAERPTWITALNQTDRVRAWAFVLRTLIEYATRPAPSLYWISKAKDFNDLMRLLLTAK